MRDGVCRNCGAAAVHWGYGEGYRSSIAAGMRRVRIAQYVCVQCGYLEEYVEPAALARIADNWEHVPVTAPPPARSDAPTQRLPDPPDV